MCIWLEGDLQLFGEKKTKKKEKDLCQKTDKVIELLDTVYNYYEIAF